MKQHRILNLILNCIIVILIVAFLAGSLYRYWDYQARPDFYTVMSRALWTLAWKGLMLHNSSKSALETSASAWWPYTSRWAISMAEWQELASVR